MTDAYELEGKVESVLIGYSQARDTNNSHKAPKISLVRGHGVVGDRHAGARLLDVREKELLSFGFRKGTEIANHREFSVVSVEELEDIAHTMRLPTPIPYGCLGENLVLSGIPRLTELPVGTLLLFQKSVDQPRTAALVVWKENGPCRGPGEAIQKYFPDIPGLATLFPKVALGKRGVVGSIYCSGFIHTGDTVVVKVPRQKVYAP